jgi:hypothetical protein
MNRRVRAVPLWLCLSLAVVCADVVDTSPSRFDFTADSTCLFVRAAAHASPRVLIEDFIARDGNGWLLEANRWADTALACPGHSATPDRFAIVSGHRFGRAAIEKDSADIDVIYDRLGTARYSSGPARPVTLDVRPETLRFTLVRTSYGWRVLSPTNPQRVRLDSAHHLFLPRIIDRLDSAARASR